VVEELIGHIVFLCIVVGIAAFGGAAWRVDTLGSANSSDGAYPEFRKFHSGLMTCIPSGLESPGQHP
jgi:hypothetical protein